MQLSHTPSLQVCMGRALLVLTDEVTREELGRSLVGKYYNTSPSFRTLPRLKYFILFHVH